jgi:hypothetical protein
VGQVGRVLLGFICIAFLILPFRRRSLANKRAPKSAVITVGAGAGAAEVVDSIMNIIRILNRKNRH